MSGMTCRLALDAGRDVWMHWGDAAAAREAGGKGTYSTVQYSTVQYSTVQYSTVQYSTVQLGVGVGVGVGLLC